MKTKTIFSCQHCGYQSPKWLGRCPDCEKWNSFVEEDYTAPASAKAKERTSLYKEDPVLLKDVKIGQVNRLKTKIEEFDRVLGGGIVPGSVVLIGGDPGIGKSTLALQFSSSLIHQGATVLYVSGEESVAQTKMRAERLNKGLEGNLYIVNQTDLVSIIEHIRKIKPAAVVIDSIQVVFEPGISSAPGSVSQVRECSGILTQLAKSSGTAIFIIGHVTKEGTIAGPRVLEHIVDTVLYFEGDRFSSYRILRAFKNRFGSTNEIGVFEMLASGLKEVSNPSEIFLSEKPKDVTGSVVVCILEGTRPVLVEIQALVSKSSFGYARRRAQGFDFNRLNLLIAVLEKRMGLHLETEDIFVSVAGGIKIEDPVADLGVCLAIASAFSDKRGLADTVLLGEVGLAGEVRSISQALVRLNEAAKLGFKHCILPKNSCKNLEFKNKNLELLPVSVLKEALDIGLT